MQTIKILMAVGTGSFIGGVFRYLLSQLVHAKTLSTFPFGTLAVNIIGCFCIGLVFGLTERINPAPEWRLFLATGLIGGFTTFSAFSMETFGLLRDGHLWYAALYITASIVIGVLATFAGIAMIKLF